jgi:hypothetical protein
MCRSDERQPFPLLYLYSAKQVSDQLSEKLLQIG